MNSLAKICSVVKNVVKIRDSNNVIAVQGDNNRITKIVSNKIYNYYTKNQNSFDNFIYWNRLALWNLNKNEVRFIKNYYKNEFKVDSRFGIINLTATWLKTEVKINGNLKYSKFNMINYSEEINLPTSNISVLIRHSYLSGLPKEILICFFEKDYE